MGERKRSLFPTFLFQHMKREPQLERKIRKQCSRISTSVYYTRILVSYDEVTGHILLTPNVDLTLRF